MIPHSRPQLTEQDIAAVNDALRCGHLAQGEEVAKLEEFASKMFNGAYAIAVSSGTAAIYLSLTALGVDSSHTVVIPSYTCNSLFSAVRFTGAKAVCADISEQSVNVSETTIGSVLPKGNCAAIIPHTCGYEANIAQIRALDIPIIEDCAQAFGGYGDNGRPLGTNGDIGIFSFYATKLVPAGEGGMCVTMNSALADTIRRLRNCDQRAPNPRAFNFKMSDISAALALSGLNRLSQTLKRRSEIAAGYDAVVSTQSFRHTSASPQQVCFRYLVNTGEHADEFIASAESNGIQCRKPVWRPLHHAIGGNCPNTDTTYRDLVSVPVYPDLKEHELAAIHRFLSDKNAKINIT
ncbi:MAG: DegT/DnrJ/EryC1/StrS aminotransferase family protein [Lentisphaerae bacterium]|nr:DegT/DnrJ/EryC1/StrS aminotransferase family protein [Lentisphaerota bacterium]